MTLYYVRPTNGSDIAAGTSFALAYQTTQKALDVAVAGDEIRLCNEATETPSARIDLDTNAGTTALPIIVKAGDSTDGTLLTTGFYTISGSSLPATTDLINFNVANNYIQFHRLRATAATADGLSSANTTFIDLVNCRIDTHASDGISWTSTNGQMRLIETEIDANTGQGIQVNAAGRLNLTIIGGSCHDNGGIGAEIGGDNYVTKVYYYEVYDNGGDGIQLLGNGSEMYSCTIYGNTGDGAYLASYNQRVYNCTSSGNGGYAFNMSALGDDNLLMDYNHTYNNTSGASNITLPGENNQTGNPNFASVTDGAEDFIPDSGSPLDRNGINGVDIGARKAADPAGGGGGGVTKLAGIGGGLVG